MNRKKKLLTYGILLTLAAVIVLVGFSFELGSRGRGRTECLGYLSDGCFTVSVLYIGCSVLMFIQEAGNFYGIQFLFHTIIRRFSPGKEDEKKTYFDYCRERQERRAAEGKSPVKSAMLLVGLTFLVLSLSFMALFYQLPYPYSR